MKKNRKKKVALIITAVFIMSMSFATVGFASGNYKGIQALFADIKVFNNGQKVSFDEKTKPFIVNGTTYVPLRALSDIFNKEIGWNGATYTINLADKPNEQVNQLWQQNMEKQNEIQALKIKIADLEAKLAIKEASSKYDIKDLQKELNYDYGKYEKINFDIELSNKKNNVEVRMYVDLDYDSSRWNSLSSSKLKSYLQKVVDDIQREFKDTSVSGIIEDSSRSSSKYKELASFYLNSKGTLIVEKSSSSGSGSSSSTVSDLQKYLNNNHYRYESVNFEIALYGDRYNIDMDIYVDENDWSYFGSSYKKAYLEKLYDAIRYDFPSAEVRGEVLDNYYKRELNRFSFDSKGYLDLR